VTALVELSAPAGPLHVYQLLMEIYLLLDDADQRTLGAFGLSVAQFNVLRHLERERDCTINELSRRLFCDKSNATRLIDRLERDGLVLRERQPGDRRYVRVRLTEAGAALRARALTAHRENVQQRFAALAVLDQAQLEQLLTALRDDLHRQLHGAAAGVGTDVAAATPA